MKVAVVGCGCVSKAHFDALNKIPETKVVAAVDIIRERADEAALKNGAAAYYDFDELLQNEKLDAVHICVPHYLHTPMAIKALERGVNVLVEKPCSVSAAEVGALREAQVKSGKALGVCFQNRYNKGVGYVKNVAESGSMGKIRRIRAFVSWSRGEEYYAGNWRGVFEQARGGVLINQAVHTVDLIGYFAGRCESLSAKTFNDHLKGAIEVEDNAAVFMKFENGADALLYATTAYSENSNVLIEIVFEEGALRLEGETLYSIDDKGKLTEICDESGGAAYPGQTYWGRGHYALTRDFYERIKAGESFAIDAFSGGEAVKIVAASYESSKTGERVYLDK